MAREAEYYGADGLIVTGLATGLPTNPEDVQKVKSSVACPVLVGSGVTPKDIGSLWNHADAFIVGSYFKNEGQWHQQIDRKRLDIFMTTVNELRSHQ